VTVLGSVLAFAIAAWVLGKTGGWIRYYITIIPLTIVLGGLVLSSASSGVEERARAVSRAGRAAFAGLMGLIVVAGILISLPTSWLTMTDRTLGRGEHNKTDDYPQYVLGAAVSDYLDAMQLPRGSVLVDVFLGFPIVLQSDRPEQFVITPDRDFVPALTDPIAFNVRYVLVPPSDGLGSLDAIKRQWPGIYSNGAGLGPLVREFNLPGLSDAFRWRLYSVID
jgi:hypothetical protein